MKQQCMAHGLEVNYIKDMALRVAHDIFCNYRLQILKQARPC